MSHSLIGNHGMRIQSRLFSASAQDAKPRLVNFWENSSDHYGDARDLP